VEVFHLLLLLDELHELVVLSLFSLPVLKPVGHLIEHGVSIAHIHVLYLSLESTQALLSNRYLQVVLLKMMGQAFNRLPLGLELSFRRT
jgi:hypothetical protein